MLDEAIKQYVLVLSNQHTSTKGNGVIRKVKKIIFIFSRLILLLFLYSNFSQITLIAQNNIKFTLPQQPIVKLNNNKLFEGGFYKFSNLKINEICNDISKTLYFLPNFSTSFYSKADKLPIAIYLHGNLYSNYKYYEGFITHLCQKGWLVIFPLYQYGSDYYSRYLYNTVKGIKDVFNIILSKKEVELDTEKIAIIAHESSCLLALHLAANYVELKLPVPKVLMLLAPNVELTNLAYHKSMNLYKPNLSKIPNSSYIIIAIGQNCTPDEYSTARNMFYAISNVPISQKYFIIFQNDFYGIPPIFADKLAFYTPIEEIFEKELIKKRNEFVKIYNENILKSHLLHQGLDSIDWFGTLRIFDNVVAMVFEGKTFCKEFLGYWSNNVPIKPPIFVNNP